MIRALIFDFDGLILDTETPLLQSWQELYDEYSVPVDPGALARLVEHYRDPVEAYGLLEDHLGHAIDREGLRRTRREREAQLIASENAMPGVEVLLADAERAGLKTAIASSSPLAWIAPHLERLGLESSFDCIKCRDDVDKVKPDPQLYASVLVDLGLESREAVAFEDAPAGAAAARRAGVYCVAIPNHATSGLSWGPVDLTVPSLSSISLDQLATMVGRRDEDRARTSDVR